VLQVILVSSGQFEASVAAGESALAMSGRHPWPMAWLAVALADWGKTGEAEALYLELQARARREYVLYRDPRFREIIAQMGRSDWLRDY
jgi:hypothetical protein